MVGHGTIWVISDLHFNHEKIIQFERTEFVTIQEHNNYLLKKIKSKVGANDTLICLGDLGCMWQTYIKKINCGKKILILGNHDKESRANYYTYFDMVFNGPIFLNQFIVLSHEPWPGCGEYCFNIHGHLHNYILDLPNYISVSAKTIGYEPLNISKVYEQNFVLKRNHEHFLEEWYAPYYKYIGEKPRSTDPVSLKDRHLLKNYKEIPDIIKAFNAAKKTKFVVKDVNWCEYQEGSDLKTFIKNDLERRIVSEDRTNKTN